MAKEKEVKEELKTEVKEGRSISLPQTRLEGALITVKGLSPLIIHRFGDKARQTIRDKHDKRASTRSRPRRGAEEIAKEVDECFYRVEGNEGFPATDGRYGFKAVGFKAAAVSGAKFGTGIPMTRAKGFFFIPGEAIPIICSKIEPREDAVRLDDGTIQLRYRPYFLDWRAQVPVEYGADLISLEQLLTLFSEGGVRIGVGDNRPQKSGDTWGRFDVLGAASMGVKDLPRHYFVTEYNEMLNDVSNILAKNGGI